MRKTALLLSFLLVFSTAIIHSQDDLYTDDPLMPDMEAGDSGSMDAGEDPFAGLEGMPDTGGTDDSGMGADIMDMGASGGTVDAGEIGGGDEDPLAGLDMGDTGESGSMDDTLLPDMGGELPAGDAGLGAGPETGGDLGLDGDLGFGTDTALGADTGGETAPALPAAKPKPKKKTGPKTLLTATLTDAVYTKDGAVKWFRNMRDYMNWGVKTSSEGANTTAKNLADNKVSTAWISKPGSDGTGEKITLKFDEIYFAPLYEMDKYSFKLRAIKFLNGYCDNRKDFEKYNRLKKVKIIKNGKTICYANMHDSMNWQTINLPYALTVKPWDKIEVKVLQVFPEVRHARDASLAVTEIALVGSL